jgi:hypothetical protein
LNTNLEFEYSKALERLERGGKQMKYLRVVWQDIRAGQNLDIYLTIIISVAIAILGIFQVVEQTIISATVLAMLALVANTLLQNRRANDLLQKRMSAMEGYEFLGRELEDYYQQNEALSTASTALFWGVTLERLIPHVQAELQEGLRQGRLKARFLLLKPESNAVKMAAFSMRNGNERRINTAINMAIERVTDLASDANKPAKLEVRVVDYLPPWTLIAFDPSLKKGKMFISISLFRHRIRDRPSFQLDAEKHGYWMRTFTEQFEELWGEAEPVISSFT